MILLDTSILIELFRVKDKSKTLFYQLSAENEKFAVSSITHYEVFVGVKQQYVSFWTELFDIVTIVPFDRDCSFEAVKIYRNLKQQNKLIDLPDIFIAATSIIKNLPLATHNIKHFARIQDLMIINN